MHDPDPRRDMDRERIDYGREGERRPGRTSGPGSWYGDAGGGPGGWYGGDADVRGRAGKPPKGYTRPDERIRDDICERIMRIDWIDASDVDIVVKSGLVTLSGTVDHREVKHRIEDIADDVPGVKDIRNEIRVQRTAEREVRAKREAPAQRERAPAKEPRRTPRERGDRGRTAT